jgi:PGF-CTERM protein
MKRRGFLSAAAGTAAGIALLQPVSASTAQTDAYRQGKAEVRLSVHHVEEKEHVTYFEDPENVTEGIGDTPVEKRHDEDLAAEGGVVRFAAGMSGDEVVYYMTRSFQQFGEMRCRYAAAEKAAAHVESALDRSVAHGSTSEARENTASAFVSVKVDENEGITLADLAAVTPRSVDATYEIDGQVYETTVPIYANVYSGGQVNLDGGDNSTAESTDQDNQDAGDETGGTDGSDNEDNTDQTNSAGGNGATGGTDENEGGDGTGGSDTTDGNNESNEAGDESNGDEGSDDQGPGFGVAGAIAGLGGLTALARKRLGREGN